MNPEERHRHLREACGEQGLRLTPQRDVLLRVLSETTGHPTAEELIQKVRAVLPSVSQATVYRNVQELVRAGLIGTLERAGGAVQFEINPDTHHHFICRRCGEVWDVYLDEAQLQPHQPAGLTDFQIDRREVQFHGLCASCR
jgi:Fe2+ or Zn2+ uptake regulation protein